MNCKQGDLAIIVSEIHAYAVMDGDKGFVDTKDAAGKIVTVGSSVSLGVWNVTPTFVTMTATVFGKHFAADAYGTLETIEDRWLRPISGERMVQQQNDEVAT